MRLFSPRQTWLSRIVAGFAFALCIVVLVPTAYASHVGEVLGDSTDLSEIDFPGVAAGPGFILPDSSLYPLDQLVQEIRLLLAFTPEQQAVTHLAIGGERLAEVRVMMNRNDTNNTQMALSSFEREMIKAAKSLADAGAKGRSNTALARKMDDRLREYRVVLQAVASQAPQSLALRLDATSQSLFEAKVHVQEQLPEDELAAAIDNDLQEQVDTQVLGVQTAADRLVEKSSMLDYRSNLLTEQRVKYEEMMASKSALRKDLLEQRKKLQQEYTEKRKKLQEERKKLYDQIKALMQSLQENQKAMRELEKAYKASYNTGATLSVTPTVTPSSSN